MATTRRFGPKESRDVSPDESRACRGCGSETTPARLAPLDLAVYPLAQDHRLLSDHSLVTAWVCPECGLLDLYADRPEFFRRPIPPRRTIAP
jgi:hypothetical protein